MSESLCTWLLGPCRDLLSGDRDKKELCLYFLKRSFLPGFLGGKKEEVPTHKFFLEDKRYMNVRKYMLAVLQFMTVDNFPELPFGLHYYSPPSFFLSLLPLLLLLLLV